MGGVSISLQLFEVCLLLLFGVSLIAGTTTDTPTLKPIIYQELGGNENHVRSKRSVPNPTTIADLEKIKHLNVLEFYIALRELYITGGHEMTNAFNSVILNTKALPDMIWQEVIRALEQSRFEIKRGETSLRRMKGMIKLNEPDSLVHQFWLSSMALLVLDNSINPKNVAYSIRDLGAYLLDIGYNRTAYPNGVLLREAINNFTESELPTELASGNKRTENLLLLHHIIGPENFNAFGDVIESMPWLVNGMYNGDQEFIRLYEARLNESIVDADFAVKLLNGLEKAFNNVTDTTDSIGTIIERLALAEIVPNPNLPIFKGVSGGPVALDGQLTRNENALAMISEIWGEIQNNEAQTRFASAAEKALSSGAIGGFEGIKNALIAGARLSKNLLGGTQTAIQKCEELKTMSFASDYSYQRIHHAIEIVKLLNGTIERQGRVAPGYTMLFVEYFYNDGPVDQLLFSSSRTQSVETMQQFFKVMNTPPESKFLELLTTLAREKYTLAEFRDRVSYLDDDQQIAKNLGEQFGIFTTDSDGFTIREALQMLRDISKSDSDILDYIRSVRAIHKARFPDQFFRTLSDISNLGWSKRWMDVWESLQHMYQITSGPRSTFLDRTAAFKDLLNQITDNLSFSEVLYSLQSLLEAPSHLPSKCQFITDFFSGLEDVETIVNAFGVKTEDIRLYIEKTNYVGSIINLLKASESLTALWDLLSWHTKHTALKDPRASLEMIGDMVVYLLDTKN